MDTTRKITRWVIGQRAADELVSYGWTITHRRGDTFYLAREVGQ